MGWPACSARGCDNWPAVGHTHLCSECIKDPAKVEEVSNRIFDNMMRAHEINDHRAYLLAFFENKPGPVAILRHIADLLERRPDLSLQRAIELTRQEYHNYPIGLKTHVD